MVLSKRWLARILMLFALIAFVLAGCGSSDEETSRATTVSDGGPATAPDSSVPETGKRKTAKPKPQGRVSDQGGSKRSGQGGTGKSEPSEEERSKQADNHQGSIKGSVCPSGMSRAECKHRIEAADGKAQSPSGKVSPSACTDVMTKEQCEEVVRAQKAAEKGTDASVSPQTCLDEYSREFCEERFKEQAEQQAGQ